KMADENVPALAPTRSNDQILSFAAWVPIGKSNYVLDLQKKQKNPIFQISTGTYSFELDETRFVLDANLLGEALEITNIDKAHHFVSPPSGEAIMDFVNELGSNVDYAELIWEEFLQAIQTFLTDKSNLGSPTKKGRNDKAHVIPYCRFTKLIISHLGRKNSQYFTIDSQHLCSSLLKEDLRMNTPYYNAYLEMVAKHDQKVAAEKEGKNKSASTKQPKPKPAIKKSSKPALVPKLKATPLQKAGKGKVAKVRTVKSSLQLVDKPDEEPAHSKPEPEHQGEGEEFDMGRAIQMSLESFHAQGHARVGGVAIQEPVAEAIQPLPVVEGKGKAIITEEQAAQSLLALHTPKRRSTTDQFIFQRRTPATEEASTGPFAQPQDHASANIVRDSPSLADAETGAGSDKTNSGGDTEILQINEELGEDVEKQVDLEEKTDELDQDQAGSNPGKTHESRPPPERVLMDEDQAGPDPKISRVALAGPDPEPTHDEFMTDLYPKVQESLKFSVDEHVILEDPLSSTGTLSSMKNLEDAYAIGSKSGLHGHCSNLSSIFLSFSTVHIAERVAALEKKLSDLEQNNKNLGSRVYTLELRDLPHKINEAVHENVKEAVQIALQAPLRDRFRDLSEEDMKEMLHQRMFETGSYKSLPEHIALYEALEASMERAQRDEFLAEKDKSRKRRRDDQDPPPPPPDSDLSKRRRHDAGASGSSQPQAPQSSAWKKSDTRDAPSSSSKQQNRSSDTDSAHLPKTKQRPEWLKPIPDDERPATPEPAWVIPTSHIPDAVNNWANALATTYQAPAENSLLEKTRDMRTFMNWYCQKMGKTELTQADLEGQAYEVVKPFYWRRSSLSFVWKSFEFKHDYTIIDSPRAVVFPVSNNERKIMRFNEIYKFSDGTLTNIMEALDYRVKEYKVNRLNPGMNTRFWTDKDVERSKEFIHAIERRLKTRRIFQNLECFVGGRVRDIDYRLLQRTE
ncbi:hypothetical protein Tco_1419500, partial [Tanacetum coccineum]